MTNYVVNVTQGQNKTAGSKAKKDVVFFLSKYRSYKIIDYTVINNRFFRIIKGIFQWKASFRNIDEEDMVLFQYPAYSRFLGDCFVHEARKHGTKISILLHDVNSLRMYKNSSKKIKRELDFINKFDFVIAHNKNMATWLVNHGVYKKIISLGIFDYQADYLMNDISLVSDKKEPTIAFTGNLGKSTFLEKINSNIPINLYGVFPAEKYPENIDYRGSFDSEKLGNVVDDEFGLVWDGDATESCTGVLGEYLKYNNPHKTSFYLSNGMPVIIWRKAALAEFIVRNGCGIVIDSLNDLDLVFSELTLNDRLKLKENAIKIGSMLRDGHFLIDAVSKWER